MADYHDDACECPKCSLSTFYDDVEEIREDCDHDEYETDVLTGRAFCQMCDYTWYQTSADLARDQERTARYTRWCAENET